VAGALAADPRFSGLKAVKSGRLAGFPQDFYSWDQPDTRWILGLQWAAKRIHPGLFADISMRTQTAAFFAFCYGIDEARFSSMIAPRLAGDDAD
jgi:iron complex transport system substrate-binding protein